MNQEYHVTADTALPFDEQLGQLESLVRQLEQGELPLEQALEVFTQGTKLVAACRAQLEGVSLKVEQVIASSAAEATPGQPVATAPFVVD